MPNTLFFGDVLRFERNIQGLTFRDLERRAGIPYQLISTYEQKKKMPSLFNAIQIAYALGCSIAYLVGDDTMTESERKKFEVIREQKILEGMEEWM